MQQRPDPGAAGSVPAASALRPTPPPTFWGRTADAPTGLSVIQLIERGLLDARTAAHAWQTLERHGSVLVAAMPQRAGKTTLLSALLDLLAPTQRLVYLGGLAETFDFVREGTPKNTLLVANELSSHLPVYLWGEPAKRTFALVAGGYAIAATLHADSADDAIALLRDDCGIPAEELARIDLIIVIKVVGEGDQISDRRVSGVFECDSGTGRWLHAADADGAAAAGLDARTVFLTDLAARGIRANAAVRAAAAEHHSVRQNGERP